MIHPLIAELNDLDLPVGDWALFGSGPLLLRGWIDHINDLDVIARGPAWEMAESIGERRPFENDRYLMLIGRSITVGNYWYYGDFDIDELIDGAEMIEGVRCVRLEYIVTYKRIADRPRDREHLTIIESKV